MRELLTRLFLLQETRVLVVLLHMDCILLGIGQRVQLFTTKYRIMNELSRLQMLLLRLQQQQRAYML